MDWQHIAIVLGIGFVAMTMIAVGLLSHCRWMKDRCRWWSEEYIYTQNSLAEMCGQVEELQKRLDSEQQRHHTLLSRHSKLSNELATTSRMLATAEEKIRHLESQKPNLPKNYLSLIQAMQACSRFISSNQWLLEQSKDLTSAVAALADVADSIESKEELCPR
jgi:chromosome segregation ATPase